MISTTEKMWEVQRNAKLEETDNWRSYQNYYLETPFNVSWR